MRTLLWFRGKELRLADHLPVRLAVASAEVIPLFVIDPYFFSPERAARLPHRMQFLVAGLAALQQALAERGTRLLLAKGRSVEVIPKLVALWQVDRVVCQRWVEPVGRERDGRLGAVLGDRLQLCEGELLTTPGTIRSQTGQPYSVFTPFSRAFKRTVTVERPWPAPDRFPPLPPDLPMPPEMAGHDKVPACDELGIVPNPRIQVGGEAEAQRRLRAFVAGALLSYATGRERLHDVGSSRLSAYLKFGNLSPRQVWVAALDAIGSRDPGATTPDVETFLNELLWREFAHHTLWDRPGVLKEPFRLSFVGFPWSDNDRWFQAWADGLTGYPVVDASSRQLRAEGFVPNRARMVSASFLTKHLLISYQQGEAHYLKYLTDGDWASNNAGWQWAAGCGCDAQPYFRVFNPVSQGHKHDPVGDYVRRWVPELQEMPSSHIHRPWEAPPSMLSKAGVRLGKDYPGPLVDHATARQRFLECAKRHLKR